MKRPDPPLICLDLCVNKQLLISGLEVRVLRGSPLFPNKLASSVFSRRTRFYQATGNPLSFQWYTLAKFERLTLVYFVL